MPQMVAKPSQPLTRNQITKPDPVAQLEATREEDLNRVL
jgi:hypothetical protein